MKQVQIGISIAILLVPSCDRARSEKPRNNNVETHSQSRFSAKTSKGDDLATIASRYRQKSQRDPSRSLGSILKDAYNRGEISEDQLNNLLAKYLTEPSSLNERWSLYEETMDESQKLRFIRLVFKQSLDKPDEVQGAVNLYKSLPKGELTKKLASDFAEGTLKNGNIDIFVDWYNCLSTPDETLFAVNPLTAKLRDDPSLNINTICKLALAAKIGPTRNGLMEGVVDVAAKRGELSSMLTWAIENQCKDKYFWLSLSSKSDVNDADQIYKIATSLNVTENWISSGVASNIVKGMGERGDINRAFNFWNRLSPYDQASASGSLGSAYATVATYEEASDYVSNIKDEEARRLFLLGTISSLRPDGDLEEIRRILNKSGDLKWSNHMVNQIGSARTRRAEFIRANKR